MILSVSEAQPAGDDEAAIRELIERWAQAVRAKDYPTILADHADDLLMFDVPPPMESRGLDAYRATWDLFFGAAPEPVAFDIQRLDVVAGGDTAYAVALMRCAEWAADGERIPLDFRLTLGLRKSDDRWIIHHEHHSIPASG